MADDEAQPKSHPFVRLVKFVTSTVSGKVSARRAKKQAQEAEAQEAKDEEKAQRRLETLASGQRRKPQKKTGFGFMRLFRGKGNDDVESDSDDDDIDKRRGLEDEDWGNVSGSESEQESEEYDMNAPQDDYEAEYEEEEDYSFRPCALRDAGYVKEPIERLGPEDLKELEETMHRMNPKYRKAENLVLEGKLEHAVNERLARLRKANKYNGLLAFGAPGHVPLNLGNIKVPTLISVSGHHGYGGNVGVNGIYERYPDNYCSRPVYQKYLEKDEWANEPQAVEFHNGAQAWALQDLDDEDGGRTFPTIHDTPRTKMAMKHTMLSAKVLPCRRNPDARGDFRLVDKADSWFIYFEDLIGAWCIGPRPGTGQCFARCFGLDEAIPDNLGPQRWQVFDIGHRKWYTHKNLRTIKGGAVSSAICG